LPQAVGRKRGAGLMRFEIVFSVREKPEISALEIKFQLGCAKKLFFPHFKFNFNSGAGKE
jgi:hypothetical protein